MASIKEELIPSYRYMKVGGEGYQRRAYLCLSQNPIRLARMLYSTGKRNLRSFGCGKRSLMRLLMNQLSLRRNDCDLRLPVFGNLCLNVNNGHLFFDFSRKVVVKLFDEGIPKVNVESEIENIRYAADQFEFAPQLRRWNVEQGWYEVEYIECEPKVSFSCGDELYDFYYRHVAFCIEKLILLRPPETRLASDYSRSVITSVHDKIDESRKLDVSNNKFSDFLSLMSESIDYENRPISLVFSHGDFGAHNILVRDKGVVVIDWEHSSIKSALFDFFSFFFSMRPRTDLIQAPRINEAVTSLQSRLIGKSPSIAISIENSADLYRRLFYVETVCRYLKRGVTPERLGKTSRAIDYFMSFEGKYHHGAFRDV